MKLSVIIVSYNVRYFLEQCLHSVLNSGNGLKKEIFVVDNASSDGSIELVKEKFPDVICIANKENAGFAKANNQAIKLAKGEYILLLNPDTVIETDTLQKVVAFMDEHPDAGGLGVNMVDGTGKFLPESKRGLPTPAVAFYKIFGLSRLFPNSKTFGKYHLSYLDKNKIHQVDVLSGAFMLMRKETLDKTGLLDETFFMYGEDIDLSYRITLAGYNNYYFPETRIIHYKGESTKKGSLNYVFMFYNAMIIFAKKHFSQSNAQLFSLLIKTAVYFRAFLSVVYRLLIKTLVPFLDAVLIYSGIVILTRYWEQIRLGFDGGHYPPAFYYYLLPTYTVLWIGAIFMSGGYDKPVRPLKSTQGIILGTVAILVLYALLPEQARFSRIITILGAVWGILATLIVRFGLHFTRKEQFKIKSGKNKRFLIVGQSDEVQRVTQLLQKVMSNTGFIGPVSSDEKNGSSENFLGNINNLQDIARIYSIDEVIFCARDVNAEVIIDKMSSMQKTDLSFKIAPPESMSIIGSNSINTAGDLYVIDINTITLPENKRTKRLFDLIASILLLLSVPFTVFLFRKPFIYLVNLIKVLFGKYSFTGFNPDTVTLTKLPEIKKGILYPTDIISNVSLDEEAVARLNFLFAREYRPENDLKILFRAFRKLDRKVNA